jgi:hypothetical protein
MDTQIQDGILAEIEAYLIRTGTSSTTLSIAATGGWAAIQRIRDGGNPNVSTLAALRRAIFDKPNGIRGPKDAHAYRRIAKRRKEDHDARTDSQ